MQVFLIIIFVFFSLKGEIRATGFNEDADRLYSQLEMNKASGKKNLLSCDKKTVK